MSRNSNSAIQRHILDATTRTTKNKLSMLTTEDKERIEQQAIQHALLRYTEGMNFGKKHSFIEGAEYATRYEREQNAKLKEHLKECERFNDIRREQIKELEAERSELINRITRLKSAVLPDEFGSTYYDLALNKVLEILNNYPDENAKRSL